MTLVAVTTVVRRTPAHEQSSFLRVVDLDQRHVLATIALPESPMRADDPNPRGGLRGARGVSAHGNRLAVARSDRVFVVDQAGRLVRELSHPLAGGIHDVLADDDGVWVTATASSLLLKFSWAGELLCSWRWSDDSSLRRALGFRNPPPFDDSLDYRRPFPGIGRHDTVHINAVVRRGPSLLVSLGLVRSPAALRWRGLTAAAGRVGSAVPAMHNLVTALRRWRLRRREARELPAPGNRGSHAIVELECSEGHGFGPARILWLQRGAETPKHNVGIAGESLLFNDSDQGELVQVDLEEGEIAGKVSVPGSPPFARGLYQNSSREIVVGSQRPAALYLIDLDERSVGDAIELGGMPWETVYAISAVPKGFDPTNLAGFAAWARLEPEDG